MTRYALATLVTATSLLLVGCPPNPFAPNSNVKDEDTVTISGKIADTDGSAYVGGKVGLTKLSVAAEDVFKAIDGEGYFRTATTDGTGAFGFSLLGKETKNSLDKAQYFSTGASKADGQSVSQGLYATDAVNTLADMRFWNGLQAPDAGTALQGDFAASWTAPDGAKNYELEVFTDQSKTGTVWHVTGSAPTVTLPKHLFNNSTAYTWQVTSHFEKYSASSEVRTFTSPADAATRSLAIASITDGSGNSYPGFHDGNLHAWTSTTPNDGQSPYGGNELVIDLGADKAVSTLVIYNIGGLLGAPAQVFLSTDKTNWGTAVGTFQDADWKELDLKGGTARYIRIQFGSETFANFTELRVLGS